MKPKKEVELTATLEILDDVEGRVDDNSPNRRTLKLSPAEIEALEREKEQLLGGLRQRAAEEPRVQSVGRTAPATPTAPDEPITIPTSPALEAATAAVEEADDELAALEQEQKALARQHAEAMKVEADAHNLKLEALRQKRNAAEAEAKRLHQVAAGVELAARTKQAEAEAARERERQNASVAEKTAALVARVQPVLDRARAVQTELKAISQQSAPTLEKLTNMTWRDLPAAWINPLWTEYSSVVIFAAGKRLRELREMLQGLEQNTRDAELLLAGGWRAEASFAQDVNRVVRDLGYSSEYVRHVREGLADLNERLASIHERGEALAPLDAKAEVQVHISAGDREAMKDRLLRHDRLIQMGVNPAVAGQTQASGVVEGA